MTFPELCKQMDKRRKVARLPALIAPTQPWTAAQKRADQIAEYVELGELYLNSKGGR